MSITTRAISATEFKKLATPLLKEGLEVVPFSRTKISSKTGQEFKDFLMLQDLVKEDIAVIKDGEIVLQEESRLKRKM